MTEAADLVLTDAEVHTLAPPAASPYGAGAGDEVHEAVAVRDGRIVQVGTAYDVAFLAGVDTDVVDCEGRVVLPGFVDAHTHLTSTGEYLRYADLSSADSLEAAVEVLRAEAQGTDDEWVQGVGWDESDWTEGRYLHREDLDAVSDERPVVAYRVDMHVATLNSTAFERLRGAFDDDDVEYEVGEHADDEHADREYEDDEAGNAPDSSGRTRGGSPTGVIVEDAVGVVRSAVGSDRDETRALVTAARDRALELGVTCVHDKVRGSHAPGVYRDLSLDGALDLRVRVDYWSDHLDAVVETGLRTNAGGPTVQTGAIKSFTDGSIGGRTAKLTEPYADVDPGERDDGGRGTWVVPPAELREIADRADDHGLQLAVHAIGDGAVAETVAAFEATGDPGAARHRVEHAELTGDEAIERMAEAGIVASCQPNFLRWAGEGGLYEQRLGRARTDRSNRYRDLLDAGVPLAFGSDSMPMDPLGGVHHAVNAPAAGQRLTVTEALRAYTLGSAYAGFDDHSMGTVEVGAVADFAVLEESPWENEGSIRDIDVVMTVVDGDVVYDGRD